MAYALPEGAPAMLESKERILSQIEEQRSVLRTLEEQLEAVGRSEPNAPGAWPPRGFYLTYYVVSGLMIGVLGSLTSFLANVLGSLLLRQDPLLFLRVYGTFFLGKAALTTTDLNFFMLVAVVHFSVGAVAGAVFNVLINLYFPDRAELQVGLGALYGVLMWIVNFYFVILWVQPMLVGEAYVLQLMPAWVALVTHVIYGLTLGVLQPLGRFVPYRPAEAA